MTCQTSASAPGKRTFPHNQYAGVHPPAVKPRLVTSRAVTQGIGRTNASSQQDRPGSPDPVPEDKEAGLR
jgi:hypothetical protein